MDRFMKSRNVQTWRAALAPLFGSRESQERNVQIEYPCKGKSQPKLKEVVLGAESVFSFSLLVTLCMIVGCSQAGTGAPTVNPGTSPTISLSPTSLSFSASQGSSNPAAQNFIVSNSGGDTLASPAISITYSSGSGWLNVNCTGSSAPYTCSAQPTIGNLTAGTYNAAVSVSSSGASNSPQSYMVAFTVNSESACELTTAMGTCGPYYDTSLTSTHWGQITQNDVWNPPSTWTQDLYSTSPGNWYAILNFPTDSSGAIHTYPSSAIQWSEDGEGGVDYEDPTLDSFTEIVASWSETVPGSSTSTVTDVGFDNWMNAWGNEVMVQTQMVNTDVCTDWATHVVATNVQFGGSNGVPIQNWNLCQNGNYGSGSVELVWQYAAPSGSKNFGESSGTIDLLRHAQVPGGQHRVL